jgi:phenylalanyl-tRNA synthetase alpha chain
MAMCKRSFVTRRCASPPSPIRAQIDQRQVTPSSGSNIPASIRRYVGMNLHRRANHPLCIVKERIERWFDKHYADQSVTFDLFDDIDPYVSVEQNFDSLLTPLDHVSRSRNDTYYVDDRHVLRCHTSAHQVELMRAGHLRFLATGDVYRCDTVDRTHFPVFHQMEGVRVFTPTELAAESLASSSVADQIKFVEKDMQQALENVRRRKKHRSMYRLCISRSTTNET